jgi:hypothetical protein
MAQTLTKYSALAVESDVISIGAGATNKARPINASLTGKAVHRNQDLTTSYEDLDLGDVTLTAEHEVWITNTAAAAVTTWVDVAVTDGTNTILFGRIRPGQPYGPICMIPQASGAPKIRLKMSSGTGSVAVKAAEAGDSTPA